MTAEWLAARSQLEAKLREALTNEEPLLPQLHQAVAAVFPDAAPGDASLGVGEAAAGGGGDDGADLKAGALDKQLVEHCVFRVLGAWANISDLCASGAGGSDNTRDNTCNADALLRDAVDADEPLFHRSGPRVVRTLDSALVLCQE